MVGEIGCLVSCCSALLEAGREEERVVTRYVLSIKTLAKELMPYIITRPGNRNLLATTRFQSLL